MIRSAGIKGFSYKLLGLGFWQAWWMLTFRTNHVIPESLGTTALAGGTWLTPGLLLTMATTAGYFVVAFCSYRAKRNFSENVLWFYTAAASAALGTLLLSALGSMEWLLGLAVLSWAAFVLISLGNALILCMWGELWSSLETAHVGRILFASYLFAFLLFFSVSLLPGPVVSLMTCSFPLASMAVLYLSRDEPRRAGVLVKYGRKKSDVVKVAVFLLVLGAAHGFTQRAFSLVTSGTGDIQASLAIDAVLLAALAVAIIVAQPEYEARFLFRLIVPAVTAGMVLMVALPQDRAFLGNGVFLFGIHGLDMLVMLVASDVAFRSKMPIATCFCASLFVERMGTTMSQGAFYLAVGTGQLTLPAIDLVFAGFVIAVVIGGSVLFTEYDFMRLFQAEQSSWKHAGVLEENCKEITSLYGLTPREDEVLLLLAMGRSGPRIAKELVISENTVRNHVSSIYRKIGVYDRQSLLDVANGLG